MSVIPKEFEGLLIKFCDYVAENTPNFCNLSQREKFGVCAYQFMQFHTRRCIARLSGDDVTMLEKDLSKWIARDYDGLFAMDTYGLPGHHYSSDEEPDDITEEHRLAEMDDVNLDEFREFGMKIYGIVFDMVKKEIGNDNEEYYQKFHDLICFMDCEDIKECVGRRVEMNKEFGVSVF